jgi:hypothetical protein
MRPVQVFDLTVAPEYSLFYLSGDPLPDAAADVLDRVADEAVAGLAGPRGGARHGGQRLGR